MNSEKCKIKLNSPENIYFSGQQIKGQITIILTKKTKIQGIKFRITGKGKTNWYEILRRESHPTPSPSEKPQRSIIYSGKETYLLEELYIMGSVNGRPIELDPGEYTYDLIYNLDRNLPSSFSGNYGSIKYKTKYIIEKPWTFNDKYLVPITIIKTSLLPSSGILQQNLIQQPPGFYQVTKNIGMLMFGGGPISLSAELPCSYAVRGSKLKLRVTVDNKSSNHIERCKFSIKQVVTFFSQQPLCLKREQITKIFKKETGGIQKKTTREYEHELQVPSCQPTDIESSRIIHIKYEVQVDVILPGLYKNLTITLPFTVCSTEILCLSEAAASTSSSVADNSIGWQYNYPNQNISICSTGSNNSGNQSIGNASRASYFADNASLYSITSDSTISENSFQRNGLDSSFRISEYGVRERNYSIGIPSHVLINNNSSSLSSSAPQYSRELPPAYEELFPTLSQTLPTAPPTSPVNK